MKKGFTLAEVLITLGIIGVVAAMTIPNLNNHLRGKKLEYQFKKTYSELNQAARNFYAQTDMPFRDYQDSIAGDKPNSTIWDSTKSLEFFMSYFKGVSKNTGLDARTYDKKYNIKNLNINNKFINAYPCDRSIVFTDMVGRDYVMDDVAVYYNVDFGPKICVDINGKNKPNKWGVDRFVFVFSDSNSVVPYTGSKWENLTNQQTNDKEIAKYCNTEMTNVAHTCAYFALKNKSPDGKGNYWEDFLRGK